MNKLQKPYCRSFDETYIETTQTQTTNESPFNIYDFLFILVYVLLAIGVKLLIFWSLSN